MYALEYRRRSDEDVRMNAALGFLIGVAIGQLVFAVVSRRSLNTLRARRARFVAVVSLTLGATICILFLAGWLTGPRISLNEWIVFVVGQTALLLGAGILLARSGQMKHVGD